MDNPSINTSRINNNYMNTTNTLLISYRPCLPSVFAIPRPQLWCAKRATFANENPFAFANNNSNGFPPAIHMQQQETMGSSPLMLPVLKDAMLDQELQFLSKAVLSHKYSELSKFCRTNKESPRTEATARKTSQITDDLLPSASKKLAEIGKVELKKLIIKRCSPSEKAEKIKKYRAKMKKWREMHPISRCYEGRRKNALKKARSNGRFAKIP